MKSKKILKIVGIVLLVVLILFLIHTIRNYIIISDLQDKISNYTDSTNYYKKTVFTNGDGAITTMEYYKKGSKEVIFIERVLNEEKYKLSKYNNGERVDTFIEKGEEKTCTLDDDANTLQVNLNNFLETSNNWQTLLGSITSNIKSSSYEGKDCYIIKGFMSDSNLTYEDSKVYIEKDTGLCLKDESDEMNTEYEYKFDNVDDSIFVEPDISQYTLKEN